MAYDGLKKKVGVKVRKDELDGVLSAFGHDAKIVKVLIIPPNAVKRDEFMKYRCVDARFFYSKGFDTYLENMSKNDNNREWEVYAATPELFDVLKDDIKDLKEADWCKDMRAPKRGRKSKDANSEEE